MGALLCCSSGIARGAEGADGDGDGDGDGEDDHAGEEILVEAQATAGPDPRTTGASVTVVPIDDRLASGDDVGSVLERVAGTTVVQLGGLGDFSAVSIRGSSLRQVQVFLDGVPLNPDGADVVNLSELPLHAFGRLEVWRSGAPAALAAAPIGGVVNLVSPDATPPPDVRLTGGSHRTGRLDLSGGHSRTLAGRPIDGFAIAEAFTTEGDYRYFDDNGTTYQRLDDRFRDRGNNDKQQLTVHGRLRWGDDRWQLTLLDAVLARQEGLAGSSLSPAAAARLDTTRNLAVARLDHRLGGGRLDTRSWWLNRIETFDDRAGEIGVGSEWQRARFSTLGATSHAALPLWPWSLGGLTLNVRRDAHSAVDLYSDTESDPNRRLSGSVAASAEVRTWSDRLSVSPVLQLTGIDNRAFGEIPLTDLPVAPASEDTELAFTPRLSTMLRPWPALTLKANVGRFLRPPDFTELFGDRGAVAGNPELKPERGVAWDVGALYALPELAWLRGQLDVAHFWRHTEDLIALVQNGQRTSVPVNLGLTWVQGLESSAELELAERLDLRGTLSWTISRNLTPRDDVEGKQLPRIPTVELGLESSVHHGELVRVGHSFTWVDGNYWDAPNFYRSPPRALHSAFVRLEPHPRWPSIELSALNLTDKTTEVVPQNPLDPSDEARVIQASSDFVGYPLPGRTWLLTVRWTG